MRYNEITNEGSASPVDIANAIADLRNQMKQTGGWGVTVSDDSDFGFSIRNWGDWQVPADAYMDQDDGDDDFSDYDWEELTPESGKKLDAIVKAVEAKYPTVKVHIGGSEKNWLDVQVHSR